MFRLRVGVHWLANSIQIQLALVVRQYTIALSVAVFCQGPKPTWASSLHVADAFKNMLPPLPAKIEKTTRLWHCKLVAPWGLQHIPDKGCLNLHIGSP